ncbi:PH domain-containing protein [Shewanella sp. 125m-7]
MDNSRPANAKHKTSDGITSAAEVVITTQQPLEQQSCASLSTEQKTQLVSKHNISASHIPVDANQWQTFDEVALQPVDDNHYTQVLTESLIFGGLLFIAASLGVILPGELSLQMVLIILTAVVLLISAVGYLRYRHAKSLAYASCEHELIMQQGFWWVKRTSLPYSRLQHVSVSHGPLERHFKLATIKCFSAGSGSAEIELPGIEQQAAEHLRQHLLAQAAQVNRHTRAVANTQADLAPDSAPAPSPAPSLEPCAQRNDIGDEISREQGGKPQENTHDDT